MKRRLRYESLGSEEVRALQAWKLQLMEKIDGLTRTAG
jgi:hypothetical protein